MGEGDWLVTNLLEVFEALSLYVFFVWITKK